MKIYFFLFIAIITIGSGCRKDKASKPACLISKLISPIGKEIKISYNAEGKYEKIENGETGETNILTYSPGEVIYSITKIGTNTQRKITVALNNIGMASSVKQEQYNSVGTVSSTINTVNEYNGKELLRSTLTILGGSPPTTNTYGWTDGNMTSSFDNTNAGSFEYYSDKTIQQADWLFMNIIDVGYEVTMMIKNKNLMKKYFGSLITYHFDAEGKIDAIYQDGSLLYNIEYECR